MREIEAGSHLFVIVQLSKNAIGNKSASSSMGRFCNTFHTATLEDVASIAYFKIMSAPEPTPQNLYTEFLASITHEFRTPLAGMKASIELLQRELRFLSPREIDELLSSMHLSVSTLQTLVDNLLESAKIDSGHLILKPRRAVINDLLAESISIVQPLLDRRQQTLRLTEPLAVPHVLADPIRTVQVIVNLLSNASHYSPLGQAIDIQIEAAENFLHVSMADRGMGIPEDNVEKLFQRFARNDAQGMNESGVGLGLSVVKAIIEAHGGSVGAKPRAGGGSIFWFTLPILDNTA